jgi:hypothetical protein
MASSRNTLSRALLLAAALLVVTGCDGQLWVVAPEQPPVLFGDSGTGGSGTDAGMGPDAASAPIPDAFTPPPPPLLIIWLVSRLLYTSEPFGK